MAKVQDILLKELSDSALRANSKLRAILTGTISICLSESKQRFFIDWKNDDFKVEENRDAEAECSIQISEKDLLKIVSGDLNPQIGILSNKIRVEGKPSLAIYFFNLLAPRTAI